MINRGHNVCILAYLRPEQLPQPESFVPSDVIRHELLHRTLYFDDVIGDIENLYWFNVKDSLREVLGQTKVIIAHFAHTPAQIAERLSYFGQRPFAFYCHGYDLYSDARPIDLSDCARRARFVVTISKHNRRFLQNLLDEDLHSKVRVIYSGIDLAVFSISSQTRAYRQKDSGVVRILSVGRLVEKKGFPDTLEAFWAVRSRYDSELRIVGDGPLRDSLVELAKTLGVSRSVHFLGQLPNELVLEELRQAHIFILPSCTATNGDREGLPKTLVEAAAMELPIVSTRHSGIPEVVMNNKGGFLVKEHDVQGLTQGMMRLIEQPLLRPEMGEQGRRIVCERFDLQKELDSIEALFYEMISG